MRSVISGLREGSSRNQRGAALILEIIIYLVIVALIAVAVTSGVKAIRELTFSMHGRADAKVVQQWVEGKYSQEGKYPVVVDNIPSSEVQLTTIDGVANRGKVNVVNGPNAGYCIQIISSHIESPKQWFFISSVNPQKIMQSGTGSNDPISETDHHAKSNITGLTCP